MEIMAYLLLPNVFNKVMFRHNISFIRYHDSSLITIDDFYKLFERECAVISQLEKKFRTKLHEFCQVYSHPDKFLSPSQINLVKKISKEFYQTFLEQQNLLYYLYSFLDINNILIKDHFNNYIPLWTETYIYWMNHLKKNQR